MPTINSSHEVKKGFTSSKQISLSVDNAWWGQSERTVSQTSAGHQPYCKLSLFFPVLLIVSTSVQSNLSCFLISCEGCPILSIFTVQMEENLIAWPIFLARPQHWVLTSIWIGNPLVESTPILSASHGYG